MKRFCVTFLLFAAPIFALLLPYFITDPFKVLYHYDIYTPDPGEPMYINLNRSMVSTKYYIKNNPHYHYDSFIFGSSKSMSYRVKDWKKHIGDSTSCFHFDEYGGSLYMMYKKICFIDKYSNIRNAILCLDDWVLYDADPPTTPLHACPPELNDNKGKLPFQMIYLRAYLNPGFFPKYIYWLFIKAFSIEAPIPSIIDTAPYYINLVTNEYRSDDAPVEEKKEIRQDLLIERSESVPDCPDHIQAKQLEMLQTIKEIFERHNCNFKIIINPLFDYRRLSINDREILKGLFGC